MNDAALGEIVGGNLNSHMVPRKNADVVLPELSGKVRQELMAVFTLHAKGRVRKTLLHNAIQLEMIVFAHTLLKTLSKRQRISQ